MALVLCTITLCFISQWMPAAEARNHLPNIRESSLHFTRDERSVTASNVCSSEQRQAVQKCLELHRVTDRLLLQFRPVNLLFMNHTEFNILKNVCADYEKLLNCEEVLSSSNSEPCLNETVHDGLIYTYSCELLLPLADDPMNIECWNKTRECDPSIQLPLNPNRSPDFPCEILLSAYRQLKCAVASLDVKCTIPDEEIIRRAIGETLYLISENQCTSTDQENLATELQWGNFSDSKISEMTDEQLTTALPVPVCKELVQQNPRLCLSEFRHVIEYLNQAAYSFEFPGEVLKSASLGQLCAHINPLMDCLKWTDKGDSQSCYVSKIADKLAEQINRLCSFEKTDSWTNRSAVCDHISVKHQKQSDSCFYEEEGTTLNHSTKSRGHLCSVIETARKYLNCVSSHESVNCVQIGDSNVAFLSSLTFMAQKTLSCPQQLTATELKSNTQLDGQVSTVVVEETKNLPVEECTTEDAEQYDKCLANFTQYGFHPVHIINNVSQIDEACTSFNQFFKCRRKLSCRPAIDGGIHNMFYYVCGTRLGDFKQQSECLSSMSNSQPISTCIKNSSFTIAELLTMNSLQLCEATKEIIACTNRRVERKCGVTSADFQFLILQSFAKGVDLSCPIHKRPEAKDQLIAFPINCTEQEEALVWKCADHFNGMTERLKELVGKGLPHVLKSVDALNEVFYDSCAKMHLFDRCWNTSINYGSNCQISSCLINVGLTVCKSKDDSAPLGDQLKCSFSLVAEPEFNQCFLSMPRTAWNDRSQLADLFPKFVSCIQVPLRKKCGDNAVRLVRSLINEVLFNPHDSSCVVNFKSLREPFEAINATNSSTLFMDLLEEPVSVASLEAELNIRNMTLYPQSTDQRPFCTVEEFINQGSCHHLFLVADIGIRNVFVDSEFLLPKLCSHLSEFINCSRSKPCRYPDNEAWENVLVAGCSSYHTELIQIGKCMSSLFKRNLLTSCDIDGPRSGRRHCPWGASLFLCSLPIIEAECSQETAGALRLLYSIYARPYGEDCILNETVSAPAMTSDSVSTEPMPTDSAVGKSLCNASNFSVAQSCHAVFPFNMSLYEYFVYGPLSREQICSQEKSFDECVEKLPCISLQSEAYQLLLKVFCESEPEEYVKFGSCIAQQLLQPTDERCFYLLDEVSKESFSTAAGCPYVRLASLLECVLPSIESNCSLRASEFVQKMFNSFAGRFGESCLMSRTAELSVDLQNDVTVSPEIVNVTAAVQPSCDVVTLESDEIIRNCVPSLGSGIRVGQILLDGKSKFLDLCHKLEHFINCTDAQFCRTLEHDSLLDMLSRFCKLEAATFNPIAKCTTEFYHREQERKANDSEYCAIYDPEFSSDAFYSGNQIKMATRSCPAFGQSLQCMAQRLAEQCSYEALKLTYELYNAYSQHYGSGCVLDIQKVQRPPVVCTTKEDKQFNSCHDELLKQGMNKFTFMGNPEKTTSLCVTFTGPYRSCLGSLNCTPEPYTKAFRETMSLLCFNETMKSVFGKSGACLAITIDSAATEMCDLSYDDDIIWSGLMDNGDRACRKLSSMLSCISDAVLERCGEESVDLLYLVNNLFMAQYDANCILEKPVLTTTTVAEETSKATELITEDTTTQTYFVTDTSATLATELETTEATQRTEEPEYIETEPITERTKTTPEIILEKTTPGKKPLDAEMLNAEENNAACFCLSWNTFLAVSSLLATLVNVMHHFS
ncbi:hypothetical protein M513_08793 [Trichuris suis]|uniref:T20D4.11-like domain-containing protein n=1 Tax=Trichuris suis TaxID=68888 RepID=A0A085LZ97_9BILA|nr:hypothetical protein M513_08793 [Trichuris suis]